MQKLEQLIHAKPNGECAVVTLPDKDTEGMLYTSFSEYGVPEPIVELTAFCDRHEIQIDVHRKPVTHGCVEAVQARSLACGTNVQLHQELKAVVLRTEENIKVAFYMCGDHELPKMVSPRGKLYGMDCEYLSSATGFSVLGMDDDPQLISGRLNPVTLFLNFNDGMEHFFDMPDHVLNGPMYTNGGCNTWGIRIGDVAKMLSIIGAQRLPGVCRPISRKTSHMPDAAIGTETYRNKVA